jgi:hypothetical protein
MACDAFVEELALIFRHSLGCHVTTRRAGDVGRKNNLAHVLVYWSEQVFNFLKAIPDASREMRLSDAAVVNDGEVVGWHWCL